MILLFFVFHYKFCNRNNDIFSKGYARCNIFSTNEFLMPSSFIYREFDSVVVFNIPQKYILSSSYRFSFLSLSLSMNNRFL